MLGGIFYFFYWGESILFKFCLSCIVDVATSRSPNTGTGCPSCFSYTEQIQLCNGMMDVESRKRELADVKKEYTPIKKAKTNASASASTASGSIASMLTAYGVGDGDGDGDGDGGDGDGYGDGDGMVTVLVKEKEKGKEKEKTFPRWNRKPARKALQISTTCNLNTTCTPCPTTFCASLPF